MSTLEKLSLIIVASSLTSPQAGAQQAPGAAIEEIVVTARKREESLQQTPLAVSAFTAQDIEDAGIDNIEDIALLTPGLTWTSLFGFTGAPVIRGVSTNIGEPNVGFFLDGVYQSSRAVMDSLLGAIERVEVAKGPQSALYGRNTFGGAVNYITKAPAPELEITGELTLGEDERQQYRLSASGPISDALSYRVGGSYYSFDGYFDNELTGGDLDDKETILFSASLEAVPSDVLDVVFRVGVEDTNNGDLPVRFVPNNGSFVPPFGGFQVFAGELPNFEDGYAVTPGTFKRDNLNASLSISRDFGGVTLTSITGFNDFELDYDLDNDYEARPISAQRLDVEQQELSQELRLSGGESLSWMVGVYYYDLEADTRDDNRFIDPGLDAIFAPPGGPLAFLGVGSVILDNAETTENIALFGEVEVPLGERWRVSVSGRLANEEKTLDTFNVNPFSGFVLADLELEDDWDSFTPRVGIDFQPTDQVMLYASVAKAIKAGGFNALQNVTPEERRYDQEESLNYEFGAKTSWLGGRLRVNGAAFLIDWEDQIVRALGQSNAILNTNAGETTSQGVELEISARPLDNLDIRAGLALTDAEYDKYIFPTLAVLGLNPDLSGVPLQNVSEKQANLSVHFRQPIVSEWWWFIRGDTSFRSEQCTVQTCDAWVGDSARTNLRTGVESGQWLLTLWMDNVFDDDAAHSAAFVQNRAAAVDVLGGAGIQLFNALVTATEPRTAGITARYRF